MDVRSNWIISTVLAADRTHESTTRRANARYTLIALGTATTQALGNTSARPSIQASTMPTHKSATTLMDASPALPWSATGPS